jgi:hypothetical protein
MMRAMIAAIKGNRNSHIETCLQRYLLKGEMKEVNRVIVLFVDFVRLINLLARRKWGNG